MAKITDKATSWVNERAKIATNHAFGSIAGTGAIGVGSIMGPNGTGKSTLSKVIMGDNSYKILNGNILFDDKDIKIR